MGLFNFFRRNKPDEFASTENGALPNIPKETFIDDSEPNEQQSLYNANGNSRGLGAIFQFLQADYETKGYNDALLNPDASYRADNIELIKHDLSILIKSVEINYNDLLGEIDFHIESRQRAGLIDLVEELNTKKNTAAEHLAQVNEIKSQLQEGKGMSQRIVLSYQRGFMRGMAAITHSSVLANKI